MARNKEGIETSRPGWLLSRPSPVKARKILLLIVELAAVIGLLIAAFHLWQVRQSLAEDLQAAQKVESLLTGGDETKSGEAGTSAEDAANGPAPDSAPLQPPSSPKTIDALPDRHNPEGLLSGPSATRGRR